VCWIGKRGAFAILPRVIRIIWLLLACCVLAPTAAQALPKPPPVKDGVSCHLDLKKTYPVAKVARSGLPLKVTCDGAAHFLPALDFIAGTVQSREFTQAYGHSVPAQIAFSHEVRLRAAGSDSQRGKLLKVARRIVQKHKRTRILLTLAVEREDGYLWSEPALNRRITLVR
jgi:hypothetical protein